MTQTLDPYEELASMFLTDHDRTMTAEKEPNGAQHATTELLIVGHLPVRATLWLTPYADAVAREAGTIGMVRLDGEEPTFQLLGAVDHAISTIEQCRNLRETILTIGPEVAGWIVRPSARVDDRELLTAGADRCTILSSSDQAALVNTYRLIKNLAETAAHSDMDLPPLAVSIIGCPEAKARDVAARLSRTTEECLGFAVPLAVCLPQIDATIRSSTLRTFPGQSRPMLREILAWIEDARSRQRTAVPKPATAAPAPDGRSTLSPEQRFDLDEREEELLTAAHIDAPTGFVREIPSPARKPARVAPAAAVASSPTTDEDRADSPLIETIAGHPLGTSGSPANARSERKSYSADLRGGAEIEGKRPDHAREPDDHGRPITLAEHVGGSIKLSPILPRCPGHERVELAVDDKGRVHLLAREDCLRDLYAVESWVRKHRELIAMACPTESIDPRAITKLHVFTDQPLSVADLHESELALHLLAPVMVEGRRGWYTAPLNAAGK